MKVQCLDRQLFAELPFLSVFCLVDEFCICIGSHKRQVLVGMTITPVTFTSLHVIYN